MLHFRLLNHAASKVAARAEQTVVEKVHPLTAGARSDVISTNILVVKIIRWPSYGGLRNVVFLERGNGTIAGLVSFCSYNNTQR